MPLSSRFKAPGPVQPFHILSIEGFPKAGKLHLATSAPGRIGIQSTDFGSDGILQRFDDYAERFLVAEYQVNIDVTADSMMSAIARSKGRKSNDERDEIAVEALRWAEEQAARVRKEVLDPFKLDYQSLLEEPTVRTIIWDKATEVNEVIRLSHHGKLEKNPKIAYGPINAEFKSLVRKAAEFRKNLILIHDLTEVYAGDEPTGRYRLKGNVNTEGLVHSLVRVEKRMEKGQPRFLTTIRDSRFAPAARDHVVENADWAMLMAELMPEIDAEQWL